MKKPLLLTAISCLMMLGAQAEKPYTAYVVSNAHFDTQWNWDVQTSIKKGLLQTAEQNMWLIDHYPNYIFNFEGGIKYQWLKEYYPLHYARIKEYIKQGRWYPSGASWDATDPIAPSTESAFRNILLGQEWYKKEFGVKSDDYFLPDSFGFGYAMPTIAAHAGIIGFSTNKLGWRYVNPKYPFQIGLWQGVDGSRIMGVLSGARYDQDFQELDLSNSQMLIDRVKESGLGVTYRYYGVGDEGGAPGVISAEAVEAGLKGTGPVKIISANSAQLYKDYAPYSKHPELPVHNGELLMETHGVACYTVHGEMKLLNRRNEQLADAAEHAAVMADWFGGLPYPAETLTEAWRRFIWHQFHDDLTGTSIPRAYTFSWNDELLSQTQFTDIMRAGSSMVSTALDTRGEGTSLVVYNPAPYQRGHMAEAIITLPAAPSQITAYSPEGEGTPVQVLSYKDGKAHVAFLAQVAPVSYTVYSLREGGSSAPASTSVAANSLENSIYKLTLNAHGDISSIIDKRTERELVKSGESIGLALSTDNPSTIYPSWEITKQQIDKPTTPITTDVRISRTEQGPIRSTLRVEKRHETSTVVQYVSLNEGTTADRIDVVTELDWSTRNCLLKAQFPLNVSNPMATYDIGLGVVERSTNSPLSYEVYAQQWAHLSAPDQSYGVAILNDSKYGWDKPNDNTLRLTLLHIPSIHPNAAKYSYQATQDFAHHRFTYSIVGHSGNYHDAQVVRKAEEMNQQLITFVAPKHDGTLGKSFSFVASSTPQVAIKMLKKSEDNAYYVVRIYETQGKSVSNAELSFPAEIVEAKEMNSIEEVIGTAKTRGNKLLVSTDPYKPKTYGIKLRKAPVAITAPSSEPITIPYSHVGISPDGYHTTLYDSDGYFDHANNSYSAELLGRKRTLQGIDYEFGIPGIANVLKCQGETIELPATQGCNKLYILAAATDRNRQATFLVDGQPFTFDIPYYSGYYGQWEWKGFYQGYLSKADLAYIGTHRHSLQNGNEPYEYTYLYRFTIDLPAGARTLQMPDDSHIGVFAVSLASDRTSELTLACEPRTVPYQVSEPTFVSLDSSNLTAGRKVTKVSNGRLSPEDSRAPKALDGDVQTAWRDLFDDPTPAPKFMDIDLGKDRTFNTWTVEHDGSSPDKNTRDFKLMTRQDPKGEWVAIDQVVDNTLAVTKRTLTAPITARYLRLEVTRTGKAGKKELVIREFSVRME